MGTQCVENVYVQSNICTVETHICKLLKLEFLLDYACYREMTSQINKRHLQPWSLIRKCKDSVGCVRSLGVYQECICSNCLPTCMINVSYLG